MEPETFAFSRNLVKIGVYLLLPLCTSRINLYNGDLHCVMKFRSVVLNASHMEYEASFVMR